MVKGQVPICYRRGGSEFSAIERWIIRRCFRFGQTRFERLPPPKAILEELADEVLGHMERLALIGFDDGIRAMTKYHAFLIEAYATRGTKGNPPALLSLVVFGDHRMVTGLARIIGS
jgi:hypothetical protein